jgi:UDP-2,3-diacylglucosamine hydrolase
MNSPVPQSPTHTGVPLWPVLQAPSHWRTIDFISDLHMQASEPATFAAWQEYMCKTPADAVFILGDLFEVWVGDDVVEALPSDAAENFAARCAQIIKTASWHSDIYFIHGNRDFLLGPAFASLSGMTLLGDPCVLEFAGERWLLSHGDALCLDDAQYMKFRAQVRSKEWQRDFLAKSLAERQSIALALRRQSETQKLNGTKYADLDATATCEWLQTADANTLIHGHTHRPGCHELNQGMRRIVLTDWDLSARAPRAEILRLRLEQAGQEKLATFTRISALPD